MAVKAGTAFVELILNDQPYKQRLSENLTSTEATAKGIETSWKALGVKNDATFNAMRRSYENALTLIKNSTTSTAQDIIRAEQAKNDQITRLNEQQFGKQTSLIGRMKENWVAATVAITATYYAVSQAAGFVKNLADAYGEQEQAESRLQAVLAAHGVTSVAVTKAYAEMAGEIQRTTIYTDEQVLSAMKIMTVMGTMPSQIKPATDAVLMLSSAFGMDLDGAAKLVGQAMEGNFERLGRMIPALKGLEKGALSASDVLEILKGSIGDVAAREAETYAGKIKQLANQYGELKETLGGAIAPTLTSFLLTNINLAHNLMGILGGKKDTAWLNKELDLLNAKIGKTENTQTGFGGILLRATTGQAPEEYLNTLYKERVRLVDEIEEREIAAARNIDAANSAYIKPVSDKTKEAAEAAKKAAKDTGTAATKAAKEEMDILVSQNTQRLKWHEERQEQLGEYYRLKDEDEEEEEEKAAKKTAQDAQDRIKIERDLYKDLRGYEKQGFDASIALINEQAETYRKKGVDEVAVAVWVAEETHKAELKKLKASNKWTDGAIAGLVELTEQHTTWGSTAYEVTKQFAKDSRSELSQNFFKMMHGNFKDLSIDWNKLWDGMTKKLSDKIADMVVEAAADQIILFFKTSWTEGGMNVLGIVNKVLGFADIAFGGGNSSGSSYGGANPDYVPESVTDSAGGSLFYQGGKIPGYAGGGGVQGYINGTAPYAGDHPGNDKVPAWVSPGEVVIRRTAVNASTEAILDYINRFGQPPQYAFGGRVMNQVTDMPGRGYWGFDSFVSVVTGGGSDVFKAVSGAFGEDIIDALSGGMAILMRDPTDWKTFFTKWADNPIVNIMDKIGTNLGMAPFRFLNSLGVMNDKSYDETYNFMQQLAHAVGSYYAMAGAFGTGAAGTGATATGAAESVAISYAKKWAINELLGRLLGHPERGQMNVDYMGANDGGVLGSLQGMMREIAPQQSRFAFSARNGLDYVPYDNFPIMAHKGERVQTAEEAEQSRNGEAITIIVPVTLNGREIARATYKGTRRGQKFIHERGITGV